VRRARQWCAWPTHPSLARSSFASLTLILPGLVLATLGLLGCGAPPGKTRTINNSLNVIIRADGRRDQGPAAIDPEDPRVVVTQKQLAELLGHPLVFEFDDAVAAKFGDGLHEAYVAALESTAQGLMACRKDEPSAFAHGARTLQTIRLAYTPVRSAEPEVTLTEPTLAIPVSSKRTDLLNGYVLCPAFERGLAAHSERRFATTDPKDLAADEQAAYFEHIARTSASSGDSSEQRLRRVHDCQRFIALEALVEDPALQKRLNDRLSSCGQLLREIMRAEPSDALLLTALDQAQSGWMRWLNEHMGDLRESAQEQLWMWLTLRRDSASPRLAKGFDAPRFGLPVIDAWRLKTFLNGPRDWSTQLERCIVAPAQGGTRWLLYIESYCRGVTYSTLASTPAGRRQLAQRLGSWQSEILIETAVLHTLWDQGAVTALALVEALAEEPQLARVGLRALAQYDEWTRAPASSDERWAVDPSPLVAAAPTWWKKYPEHRAGYLYLLARIGEQRESVVPWSELGKFLGGRIDAATLGSFLALDPGNVWYASQLTAALDPGWPRAPAVTRGVDAFLEAFNSGKISRRIPDLLDRVVSTVCHGGSRADLQALRSFAAERSEIYDQPHIGAYLRIIKDAPTAMLCPARAPAHGKKPSEPVVFGD
jgi:hypothetical protein